MQKKRFYENVTTGACFLWLFKKNKSLVVEKKNN